MGGALKMESRPCRSDEEWMRIITACRQSGLPDRDWCAANGIVASSFYNAIVRLRKKACTIPKSTQAKDRVHDLTSKALPDIVPVAIMPKGEQASAPQTPKSSASHDGELHTIKITTGNLSVSLCNGTDPALVDRIMSFLVKQPC